MAGTVKGLVQEKEVVGNRASNATQRVLELEAKVRELEGAKLSLEAQVSESSSRIKGLEGAESSLQSRVSGMEVTNKEIGDKLILFKKKAIDQHEKGF